MSKLATLVYLLMSLLPAYAQEKVELISPHIDLGFFQADAEITLLLFQGINTHKIKPLNIGRQAVDKMQKYYDENIADTLFLRPSDWHLEVVSENNQINKLVLFFPKTTFCEMRRIHLKYKECKAYLQALYKNSLKHNKIDRLEAVWFDFENRGRQVSMIEALEKHYYRGFLSHFDGVYPEEAFKSFAQKKAVFEKNEPFFMQNAPTEKHTVLYREVDFSIFDYPFRYSDFDKLPFQAHIDSAYAMYCDNLYPNFYKTGLGPYMLSAIEKIDSTQTYRPNEYWEWETDNFMHRLRDGILVGKIKIYEVPKTMYERDELKQIPAQHFDNRLSYFDKNVNGQVYLRMQQLSLSWKEYYYMDLQGNFLRSEIDLFTLVSPKGSIPDATFGNVPMLCMKFSEIKAYFKELYKDSQGEIAQMRGICMAEALETHQHHTSIVWKYFNPFGADIVHMIANINPDTKEHAKYAFQRVFRNKIKDKLNNIEDAPIRNKMPSYFKSAKD